MQLEMGDNSMSPKIEKGDILIIEKTPEIIHGSISVVLITDNPLIRRISKNDKSVVLVPLNTKDFDPVFIPDGGELKVLGRVTEIRRSLS